MPSYFILGPHDLASLPLPESTGLLLFFKKAYINVAYVNMAKIKQ